MKKFLLIAFLLSCGLEAFSQKIVETSYYDNHPELGGEAVIQKSTSETKGDKTFVSFEVKVPAAGTYYPAFWLCPARHADGSFAKYAVSVNGRLLTDLISPVRGDWQSIGLSKGGAIYLNSGVNIISVIGSVPDIPSVEHVKLSKNAVKSMISGVAYRNYRTAVESQSALYASRKSAGTKAIIADSLSQETRRLASSATPPCNFDNVLNVYMCYTFYKTVSFTQGQQVFIATNGINGFDHVLELFSASSPEQYSWSTASNRSCLASLNINIPSTGMYYVRVRSLLNSTSGLCNLNINGENYYDSIPVYSIGIRSTQGTDNVYNTFTCHNTGDPRIWIEDGPGIPGKIIAYNDDYGKPADFAWGHNARIKKQYPQPAYSVLMSTYSSYNPNAKCDIYARCQNSDITPDFEILKEDDAIQSAPASTVYNCISWSGGIWQYWEWPPSNFSTDNTGDPLVSFDKFYDTRGYTREGATEANSVIDLWAIVNSDGSRAYKHASLRKEANSYPHGYDWESKPGSLMRTFHPRYALKGDGYGQVVEHYIAKSQSQAIKTLAEQIADGTSKIEYVNFTADEEAYINKKADDVSGEVLSTFENLYHRWQKVFASSIYSNPADIANCDEYKALLSLCKENAGLKYAVFKHLGNEEIEAMQLVEDLTLKDNLPVLQAVRTYNASNKVRSGVKTYRPDLSNAIDYVKRLLSTENINLAKAAKGMTTGISYSNFKSFNTQPAAGNVNVTFNLNASSKVSLSLVDLTGNFVATQLKDENLDSGEHTYSLHADKAGTYLVVLTINGHANVRKIILNK